LLQGGVRPANPVLDRHRLIPPKGGSTGDLPLPAPIVYLTAYADEDTLARAKKTSPCAYLLKPYNDRGLYTTVEVTLEKHARRTR
jgi:CheY-like chemotaxis protein